MGLLNFYGAKEVAPSNRIIEVSGDSIIAVVVIAAAALVVVKEE